MCLVCSTGGIQQVRAVMKGSDVSSIHERLMATCGDENASLSLYWAGYILRLQVVLHASHQGAVYLARTRVRIYSSTLGNSEKGIWRCLWSQKFWPGHKNNKKRGFCNTRKIKSNTPESRSQNNLLHGRERKVSLTTDDLSVCRIYWRVL